MLIRHATVLSMDPEVGDLPRGDVLVEGDRIAAVGRDLANPDSGEVIDGTGCIVVPGFVDTHRHMWEGVLRGRVAHGTLRSYFQGVLLRIAPAMTPSDLAVSEALSARAALDAGITTVQDTSDINGAPERTDAIVTALRESGLRAVFAYGLARTHVTAHGSTFPEDVRRVRDTLLPDDEALVTMALETQNGDDDAERANAALARELGLRTAHHVRSEIRPSRLRDLGALLPGTTFVHGNGLDARELAVIADAGGSLSIAPVVERVLGLGTPMIGEALAVPGLPVALSTDVEVTGPTDMFSQMRDLYLTARSATPPAELAPRDVLHIATLGGARALGMGDRIGSLTVGKQADLLVLRADRPDVAPVADPYGAVVLQMDRSHVDTVLVAGVVRKSGGRPLRDDTALLEEAEAVTARLASEGVFDRAKEEE
jgi:5-methylthioadenosine/S-adenosylhomocysteine deaminase